MIPVLQKNLENLLPIMAIIMFFESFARKFCLIFLTLTLSASANMMDFARIFLFMRA